MKQNKITLFLLGISLGINAYSQFTVNTELRTRSELRDGYRSLATEGSDPSVLIWQRSRISFGYQTDNLKLKFTPQDVRLWGDESQRSSTGVFGDDSSLELFEAYAELKIFDKSWISVGRQPLKYDNQRLLAARNWNNNGMTYDALLAKLNFDIINIHLGSTWNSMEEASSDNLYPSNRIKNLNFLWLNGKITDNLSLSIMNLATGITETDTTNQLRYKFTNGFYTTFKSDGLNAWGEAYYQYGKNTSNKKVSAFMFAADANYKIGIFSPGLGITYLSGNDKTGTDLTTDKMFDILYGARHRFYGYIDYFRNFSSHTAGGGLVDYYFYFNFNIIKKITILNTGHYFQLAKTNPDTPDNKNLGYENDLTVKYKFQDWATIETGYLQYFPTESLETIQDNDNAKMRSQFLYVQLTLKPTLFKQKISSNN